MQAKWQSQLRTHHSMDFVKTERYSYYVAGAENFADCRGLSIVADGVQVDFGWLGHFHARASMHVFLIASPRRDGV